MLYQLYRVVWVVKLVCSDGHTHFFAFQCGTCQWFRLSFYNTSIPFRHIFLRIFTDANIYIIFCVFRFIRCRVCGFSPPRPHVLTGRIFNMNFISVSSRPHFFSFDFRKRDLNGWRCPFITPIWWCLPCWCRNQNFFELNY